MDQVLFGQQIVVLPTTGQLDQVMEPHVRPLMVEVSQMVTILVVHQAGQTTTHLALVLQADRVLAQALVLQVEVRVGPQAAQAQEDPEEGGINSPFFLRKLPENPKNFVKPSTLSLNT